LIAICDAAWNSTDQPSSGRPELIEKLKAAGSRLVLVGRAAAIEEAWHIIGKGRHFLWRFDSVGGDAQNARSIAVGIRGVIVPYSAAPGRPLAVQRNFP